MTAPAGLPERLGAALRELPDPPVDMRAARALLQERTAGRRRVPPRRLAVAAIVCLILVALVAGLGRWRSGRDDALVSDRLPSGLPIGRLAGSVDHVEDDDLTHSYTGRWKFWYVVNKDGTGSFRPPALALDDSWWPVRYLGHTPGRVRVVSDKPFCDQTTDVVFDFRVKGNTVTITRAKFGKCTNWTLITDQDLRGVKLRWAPAIE
jgi:hypothetical protein